MSHHQEEDLFLRTSGCDYDQEHLKFSSQTCYYYGTWSSTTVTTETACMTYFSQSLTDSIVVLPRKSSDYSGSTNMLATCLCDECPSVESNLTYC